MQLVTKLVETLCPEGHISYFFDTVYFNLGSEAIPPNPLEQVYFQKKLYLSLPHPLKKITLKGLVAYKRLCFAKWTSIRAY